MENSVGLMTVFAVSGNVAHVARQAHKRRKVELQLGTEGSKVEQKKKVRFGDDVVEPSSNNEDYRRQSSILNID
ncbi:hypothetical protein MKW98_019897 [Papaver atlanticum]|uniref:Uncharacterized protein n=1 Tax=Papaver atlanticum TaxID=357466 RepID=A0AAD4X771_9MAGN|nr:hypothetical protein MKW98_019897 [Papaver atlanticum]